MNEGVRWMWMRGGTSKGAFFLAEDLPADAVERDTFLLRVMDSPDLRQIDGMGGGDPLTSKVAVISQSAREGVDIDYLFLQVFVDQAIVSGSQNCGNMLAGVGPFAIERGLINPEGDQTPVTIHMQNTGQLAVANIRTPQGCVTYAGDARIDGVPGSAAPILLEFHDTAGSSCGALLPTGNAIDVIGDVACTLIDNGMPCIVIRAEDVGATGYEDRTTLDADEALKGRIEAIRLTAGPMMNLGDVATKSVPKIMLVAATPTWGNGDGAQLHSPPRACLHRRAWRGDGRDRVPLARLVGGIDRDDGNGASTNIVDRTSNRRDKLCADARRRGPGGERGAPANRPQADGRHRVHVNGWMHKTAEPGGVSR